MPVLLWIIDAIVLNKISEEKFIELYEPLYKRCDNCLELIKKEAKVCRYCKTPLNDN